jgi:hypothetical protein
MRSRNGLVPVAPTKQIATVTLEMPTRHRKISGHGLQVALRSSHNPRAEFFVQFGLLDLGEPEDAEDAVQDAFMRIFRAFD